MCSFCAVYKCICGSCAVHLTTFSTYLLLLHFGIEEGKKRLNKLYLGAYKTLIYFLIEFVTNSVTKEVK